MSPDGRWVAAGGERLVLWETEGETLEELMPDSLAKSTVSVLAFSPDGRVLAVGFDSGAIELWDVDSRKLSGWLSGSSQVVTALAFAPDGARLAGHSEDQTTRIWDVASGRLEHLLLGARSRIDALAFHPDGEKLVSGSDGLRLCELASDAPPKRLSCGFALKLVQAFLLAIGRELTSPQVVAFSPDGRLLAAGMGDQIELWEAATGRLLKDFRAQKRDLSLLAFGSDGKRLASGGRFEPYLRLWDVGKLLE